MIQNLIQFSVQILLLHLGDIKMFFTLPLGDPVTSFYFFFFFEMLFFFLSDFDYLFTGSTVFTGMVMV
jgi:hypothetical protein